MPDVKKRFAGKPRQVRTRGKTELTVRTLSFVESDPHRTNKSWAAVVVSMFSRHVLCAREPIMAHSNCASQGDELLASPIRHGVARVDGEVQDGGGQQGLIDKRRTSSGPNGGSLPWHYHDSRCPFSASALQRS